MKNKHAGGRVVREREEAFIHSSGGGEWEDIG